jgi:hypothetical protein
MINFYDFYKQNIKFTRNQDILKNSYLFEKNKQKNMSHLQIQHKQSNISHLQMLHMNLGRNKRGDMGIEQVCQNSM